MKKPHVLIFSLFALAGAAIGAGGCNSNKKPVTPGAPVSPTADVTIPEGAHLIAYAKGTPDTVLPPQAGTVYVYEEESKKVVYVITIADMPADEQRRLDSGVAEDLDKKFSPSNHYRVYFLPLVRK